ncbi:MAG TPA: type II secretion system major pseudopilin GspG [Tepidisphaeraceae bacterium]|nr:type II secretion system major pseudopilin GspG [Tepidisphaeraceae bacterium]
MRGGFTLIELLLVLVILTVLAALIVPQFTARSQQAKNTAAKTDIASLGSALDTFEIDNGRYPTNDEGLNALVQQPAGLTDWHGPYIKMIRPDPWGNAYIYRYPGQHNTNSYDLSSAGPDGHDGDDDDVTNWK